MAHLDWQFAIGDLQFVVLLLNRSSQSTTRANFKLQISNSKFPHPVHSILLLNRASADCTGFLLCADDRSTSAVISSPDKILPCAGSSCTLPPATCNLAESRQPIADSRTTTAAQVFAYGS